MKPTMGYSTDENIFSLDMLGIETQTMIDPARPLMTIAFWALDIELNTLFLLQNLVQEIVQKKLDESLAVMASSSDLNSSSESLSIIFDSFDEVLEHFRERPEGVLFLPTHILSQTDKVIALQKMSVWMPQVKLVAFDETDHYTQEVVNLMNQNVLFWKLNLSTTPDQVAFYDREGVEIVLKEAYQQLLEGQALVSNPPNLIWQIPASSIERELFHLVETASFTGEPCWELPVLMKRWAIAVGGDPLESDQAFWFGALSQMDLSRFWISRVDLSVETLGWLISVFYEGRTGRWVELFHQDKTLQHPLALPIPMGSPNLLQDEEMAQVLRWFSAWLSASEAGRETMLESGENWFTSVHWQLIMEKLILPEQGIDLETVFQDDGMERQAG